MGNRSVTPQHLRRLRAKYDRNNDNKLHFEEARAMASEIATLEGLQGVSDTQLRTVFDKLDKDGSGYISFEEFDGACWALLQQMRQAKGQGGAGGGAKGKPAAQGAAKGAGKAKGRGKGTAAAGAGKGPAAATAAAGAGKGPAAATAAAGAGKGPAAAAAKGAPGKGAGKRLGASPGPAGRPPGSPRPPVSPRPAAQAPGAGPPSRPPAESLPVPKDGDGEYAADVNPEEVGGEGGAAEPVAGPGEAASKEEMEAAATKIQALRRGSLARQELAAAKAKAAPKQAAKPGLAPRPTAKPGVGPRPAPAGTKPPATASKGGTAAQPGKGKAAGTSKGTASDKASGEGKVPAPKAGAKTMPKPEAQRPNGAAAASSGLDSQSEAQDGGSGGGGAGGGGGDDEGPDGGGDDGGSLVPAGHHGERPDRGLLGAYDLDPSDELLGGIHDLFTWATSEAPPPVERAEGQGKVWPWDAPAGQADEGQASFWPWDQPQEQQKQDGQPSFWPFGQQDEQKQEDEADKPWWLFGIGGQQAEAARLAGGKQVVAAAPSAAVRRQRRPTSVTIGRPPEPVDRRFPLGPQLREPNEDPDPPANLRQQRGRSAPHSRRGALQDRLRAAELQQLQSAGITALLPDDSGELSAPESQESTESISGDVVRPWDPTARDKRYHYPRDRAVEFSQNWQPLEWSQADWEKMLRDTGTLAPPEQRRALEARRSVQRERQRRRAAEDRPVAAALPPQSPRMQTFRERLGFAAAGTAPVNEDFDDEALEEFRRLRKLRRQQAREAAAVAGGVPLEPQCDPSCLRVRVVSASSITSGVYNLSSDPYVRIRVGQQTKQTRVLKKTGNPYWDELLEFEGLTGQEAVTVTVWDQDVSHITSDELLGRLDLQISAFEKRLLQGQIVKVNEMLRHQLKKDGMAEISLELSFASLDEDDGQPSALRAAGSNAGGEAASSADGLLREETLNSMRLQALNDYSDINRSMGSVPLFPDSVVPGPGQAWL